MLVTLIVLLSMVSTPVITSFAPSASPDWVHPLGATAVDSPLINENLVYIATSDGWVTAFNTDDGSIEWQSIPGELASQGLAIVDDKLLIPATNGTLYVLDAFDGSTVSALSLGSVPLVTPLVHNDTVIVADSVGTVTLLDSETMTIQSQVVLRGTIDSHGALGASFAVYVTVEGILQAIDIESGDIAWETVPGADAVQPFALEDGDIIIGSGDGIVSRYSIDDGSLVWQTVLQSGHAIDYAQTPDGLLVASEGGGVQSLDAASGDLNWIQVLRGDGVFASDTCVDQCLVSADGDILTAISTADGELRDITVVSGGELSVNIVADDDILVVVTGVGDVMLWRLSDD